MKLKTIFLYIVLTCLLCSLAFAEGDTDAGISVNEINAWVNEVLAYQKANLAVEPAIEESELGFEYQYGGITLYYDSRDAAAQKLIGLRLSEPLLAGPRNEMVLDEKSSLFERYPNDNPELIGDRDFAFLYIDNELPQRASWGFINRDGQRVRNVKYTAHEQTKDGNYSNLSLQFEVEHNAVVSISVFGLQESVNQSVVLENIAYAEGLRELHSYHAYKSSANGTELNPFEREDLSFSGLDYLSMTPDTLIERFGEPDLDETSTQDNLSLRSLSWDAVDASFRVDASGKSLGVYRFTIRDDVLEGPRGLRVGDSFSGVYSRFRSTGMEPNEENIEFLYGSPEEDHFGAVSYYPEGIEVSMKVRIMMDNGTQDEVVLNLNFDLDKLTEITIYTN